MSPRLWIAIGALLGATGVGLGAFGAHGLGTRLTDSVSAEAAFAGKPAGEIAAEVARRVDIYETAVRYQMYHAPAVVLVGILLAARPSRGYQVAGWAFLFGVLVFSGLLYILVFTGVKVLGAIVPFGGAALIVGWASIAVCSLRSNLNAA